jgi:hypothetical protein
MNQISRGTIFFLGIAASCALAQAPQESTDSQIGAGTQSSQGNDVSQSSREDGGQMFAGSLNGSGLFSMADQERGVILSATAGGGWDSNPSNGPNGTSSSAYSLSPYISIHGASPMHQFILQYQPTILGYPFGGYSNQILHAASAQAMGTLSERWDWKMDVNASHGENGARFLAPQPSVPVGEVPGTGTSTASFLPNSNSITYIFGSLKTTYRRSDRGRVGFDLASTFNSTNGSNQSGEAVTGRLGYSYDLSPTVSLTSYGQISQYYGVLRCRGVGGGLRIRWQAAENTVFSAEGGPQINTSDCGTQQGYSYSLEYSSRISSRAQLYLTANRLPMVSYLGPGVWQNGASGGLQYKVTRAAMLRVDFAFANSSSLSSVSSYRGTSFNASYDVLLRRGFALSYSYRGYITNSGGNGYSRGIALVSLIWRSNSGKFFRN